MASRVPLSKTTSKAFDGMWGIDLHEIKIQSRFQGLLLEVRQMDECSRSCKGCPPGFCRTQGYSIVTMLSRLPICAINWSQGLYAYPLLAHSLWVTMLSIAYHIHANQHRGCVLINNHEPSRLDHILHRLSLNYLAMHGPPYCCVIIQ